MFTIRKSLFIATLTAALAAIALSDTAEAGHGFHRYRHRGFSIGWGGYGLGGYGWGGLHRPWGWGHHGWGYARPLYRHYYAPVRHFYYAPVYYQPVRYYAPLRYYAPACYGWAQDSWSSYRPYGLASKTEAPQELDSSDDLFETQFETQEASDDQLAGGASQINLKVEVPEDARVIINDRDTSLTGTMRSYRVKGVSSKEQYDFVVRAEVERAGKLVTETRTVRLSGGGASSVSFDFAQSLQETLVTQPIDTTIKMRVPEGAKVYLSGNETKQRGTDRVFVTKRLSLGEQWEDYDIRVTWQENGRLLAREKRITLAAGDTHEIEFDKEMMVAVR